MKLDEFHVCHAAARSPSHGDAVAGGGVGIGGIEVNLAGAPGRQHRVLRANGADRACYAIQHISAVAAVALLTGVSGQLTQFGAGNEIDGGKIYYELADERTRRADATTAIVRLEKLYPWWPQLVAAATLDKYPKLAEVFWVQEEPSNMGAGQFVTPRLQALLGGRAIKYEVISRAESASPATGSHKAHVIEQQEILGKAFGRP